MQLQLNKHIMNKKQSDALKAAARKQHQQEQSAAVSFTATQHELTFNKNDYSRYFVWGTAVLLVMIFIIF